MAYKQIEQEFLADLQEAWNNQRGTNGHVRLSQSVLDTDITLLSRSLPQAAQAFCLRTVVEGSLGSDTTRSQLHVLDGLDAMEVPSMGLKCFHYYYCGCDRVNDTASDRKERKCSDQSTVKIKDYLKDTYQMVDNIIAPLEVFKNIENPGYLESIFRTFVYWFCHRLSGSWVSEMKYQLNYLFVYGEINAGEDRMEYPVRDPSIFGYNGQIALGIVQKRINLYLRTKSGKEKNRCFRNTLLQGVKRGMPTVDPEFILKSAKKNKASLSVIRETPDDVLDFIDWGTAEIIKPYKWGFGGIGSFVSTKSCTERTIPHGGVKEHLRDFFLEGGDPDLVSESNPSGLYSYFLCMDQLYRMYYHPRIGVFEDRFRVDWGLLKKMAHEESFTNDRVYQNAKAHITKVKFILEPLKCRTITKAPAFHNGVYKEIQQHMWNELRKMKQFCLIGEPVTSSHILDLELDTHSRLGLKDSKNLYWVSGDYSAATDNLNTDATKAVIGSFARSDIILHEVLTRALTGNTISYQGCHPSISGKKGDHPDLPTPFEQSNGQLMGCVFSFPILCVVNFLIFKYCCMRYYGRDSEMYKNPPVLVNGDDILYLAEPDFIDLWTETIKSVGFEKSVGKNFEAKNFCTINSKYFLVNKGAKVIPYINNGFLFDCRKGSDSETILSEVNKNNSLFLLGFSDFFRDWAGSPLEKLKGRALASLFHHRRDIGWSSRTLYDLGLSDIDDDPIPLKYFRQKVSAEKGTALIGVSSECQSSNSLIISDRKLEKISTLKKQCMDYKYFSPVVWAADQLISQQRKVLEERVTQGLNPLICRGIFYRAVPMSKFSRDTLNLCKSRYRPAYTMLYHSDWEGTPRSFDQALYVH